MPAWSNPIAEFGGNLWDVIRGRLSLVEAATPDRSWYGAEFQGRLPWRRFRDSLLLHAGLIALLCAFSAWPEARVHLVSLRARDGMDSLYLPELHGARVVRKHGGKADPVRARQEIRSVPVKADNRQQTIAMLSRRKLQRQIELPNFVAYQAPPAPPLDKSALGEILRFLHVPELAERTPEIVQRSPQRAAPKTPAVQPAPEITTLARDSNKTARLIATRDPALPLLQRPRAAEIVQPRPQRVPSIRERVPQSPPDAGVIAQERPVELARLIAPAGNPNLPVLRKPRPAPEIVQARPQRSPTTHPAEAMSQPESAGGKNGPALNEVLPQRLDPALPAAAKVESQPQLTKSALAGDPGMQQVLALSAHPADVPAPSTLPEGNRSGAFAASPAGHENATGEPGTGTSSDIGAHDSAAKLNAPPGISVGAPPDSAEGSAVSKTPSLHSAPAEAGIKAKLQAVTRAPAMASLPPHLPPQAPSEREPAGGLSDLENQVFAGRRSYRLVINMPNLNATNGSWIIRYSERDPATESGPIIAPEVIFKSDPALRAEMIEGGLHGTVVLAAIILADGSVDQIHVLQGVFPELDRNAAEALSRWHFRPALKDGQPIAVKALVAVPFRKR